MKLNYTSKQHCHLPLSRQFPERQTEWKRKGILGEFAPVGREITPTFYISNENISNESVIEYTWCEETLPSLSG